MLRKNMPNYEGDKIQAWFIEKDQKVVLSYKKTEAERIKFKSQKPHSAFCCLMQGPFAYVYQMCHPSDGDIHCSGALWRVCTAAELF